MTITLDQRDIERIVAAEVQNSGLYVDRDFSLHFEWDFDSLEPITAIIEEED